MPDVSTLVQQMQQTLTAIHETITSLDPKVHDEKLDALEAERDAILAKLLVAYERESSDLTEKRKHERDEIVEKRRKEDEEIAARRRREDEELNSRDLTEDAEREQKLEAEKKDVEESTDSKMEQIEDEAQRAIDEGHNKLQELEGKRQEIHRLIDEQMKVPLPTPPKRKRRGTARSVQKVPDAATEVSQPEPQERSAPVETQDSSEPVAKQESVKDEEPAGLKNEADVPEEPVAKVDDPAESQLSEQAAHSENSDEAKEIAGEERAVHEDPPAEVPQSEESTGAEPSTKTSTEEKATTEEPAAEALTTESPAVVEPASEMQAKDVPSSEQAPEETTTESSPTDPSTESESNPEGAAPAEPVADSTPSEPTAEAPATNDAAPENSVAEEQSAADAASKEAQAEEPQTGAPQAEESKNEVTEAAAPQAEAPQAEAPQAEAPQAEKPQAEEIQAGEPKAEAPEAAAPQAEESKVEVPKAEEPQAEEPKAEATEASDQAEEPQAEEAKAEAPEAEAPQAEEPQAEEPQAEAPHAEAPQAEEPQAEEPQAEAPHAEAPQAEESKAEEPQAEEPKAEATEASDQAEEPQAEEPKVEVPEASAQAEEHQAEEPQAEEPQAEVPQAEESKVEAPQAEEPKVEVPEASAQAEEHQAEEPQAEEPQAEEPQAEVPQAEESKVEAPQAEEPKVEVPEASAQAEEPQAEVPEASAQAEEPQAEESKAEARQAEEPQTKEPQVEESKTEVPEAEEATAEEVATDDSAVADKAATGEPNLQDSLSTETLKESSAVQEATESKEPSPDDEFVVSQSRDVGDEAVNMPREAPQQSHNPVDDQQADNAQPAVEMESQPQDLDAKQENSSDPETIELTAKSVTDENITPAEQTKEQSATDNENNVDITPEITSGLAESTREVEPSHEEGLAKDVATSSEQNEHKSAVADEAEKIVTPSGIVEGGAAEEYFEMAKAEEEPKHDSSETSTSDHPTTDKGGDMAETHAELSQDHVEEPEKPSSDESLPVQKGSEASDHSQERDLAVSEAQPGNVESREETTVHEDPSDTNEHQLEEKPQVDEHSGEGQVGDTSVAHMESADKSNEEAQAEQPEPAAESESEQKLSEPANQHSEPEQAETVQSNNHNSENPKDAEPVTTVDRDLEASAEETQAAVEAANTPVEEVKAPAEEVQAPVEETQPSVEETEASMDNAEATVEEFKVPVEETEASNELEKASAEDVEAPTEEVRALAEEAKAPVEDASSGDALTAEATINDEKVEVAETEASDLAQFSQLASPEATPPDAQDAQIPVQDTSKDDPDHQAAVPDEADAPAPIEESSNATKSIELIGTEAPTAEAPAIEEPAAETPAAETPAPEAPTTIEASALEASVEKDHTQSPTPEAPAAKDSGTDAPITTAVDETPADVPGAEDKAENHVQDAAQPPAEEKTVETSQEVSTTEAPEASSLQPAADEVHFEDSTEPSLDAPVETSIEESGAPHAAATTAEATVEKSVSDHTVTEPSAPEDNPESHHDGTQDTPSVEAHEVEQRAQASEEPEKIDHQGSTLGPEAHHDDHAPVNEPNVTEDLSLLSAQSKEMVHSDEPALDEHEVGEKLSDSGYDSALTGSRTLDDPTSAPEHHQHDEVLTAVQENTGSTEEPQSAAQKMEAEIEDQKEHPELLEGAGNGVSPSKGEDVQESGNFRAAETSEDGDSEPATAGKRHEVDNTEGSVTEVLAAEQTEPAATEEQESRSAQADSQDSDSSKVQDTAPHSIEKDQPDAGEESTMLKEDVSESQKDKEGHSAEHTRAVQDNISLVPDSNRGESRPTIDVNAQATHDNPDEGLFAVPPTPRQEIDQSKPEQLQDDGIKHDRPEGSMQTEISEPQVEQRDPVEKEDVETRHEPASVTSPGLPSSSSDEKDGHLQIEQPTAAQVHNERQPESGTAEAPASDSGDADAVARDVVHHLNDQDDQDDQHHTTGDDNIKAGSSPATAVADHEVTDPVSLPEEAVPDVRDQKVTVDAPLNSDNSIAKILDNPANPGSQADTVADIPHEEAPPALGEADSLHDGRLAETGSDDIAHTAQAPSNEAESDYGSDEDELHEQHSKHDAHRDDGSHPNDDAAAAASIRQVDSTSAPSEAYDMTSNQSAATQVPSSVIEQPPQQEAGAGPEKFERALSHLPDESAHTVQGTDQLFDDDDDEEYESASEYGEAVVSPPERIIYQAHGDDNNVSLGGNRSSTSLGRNSVGSARSMGHQPRESRGSFSSIQPTTPVRVTDGSYLSGVNIVRADWAAEHEEELRPSQRGTPLLEASTAQDTSEISSFALRNPSPIKGTFEERGLSSSRWNSEAPRTPPPVPPKKSNNPFRSPETPEAVADTGFVPRDVTNMPWHARNDSVPMSLHSQTTLSSVTSSPVHSALPADKHEPVIRDSWPAPAPSYQQYLSSWTGRNRGDSTVSTNSEYDPFKSDTVGGGTPAKTSIYNPFQQRTRAESSVSAAPTNTSATTSNASPGRGSALFQKMRNIFETQTGPDPNASMEPMRSPHRRPPSGSSHPITTLQRTPSEKLQDRMYDPPAHQSPNEVESDLDESMTLLRGRGVASATDDAPTY